MKKILFLDFDGVLNTEKYQRQLRTEGRSARDGYGPLFDPEAVENLRMILDTTGAEIIVSSSWKLEGLGKMRSLWHDRSLPGKVAGITPDTVFNPDLLSMDLEDPEVFMHLAGKGNEVRMWLEAHPGEVRYAILDDVPDFLPEQEPFYVMTDPRTGITTEIALKVINILNGQA
ncbi:MAG: hypothetical protein IJ222_04630 [Bacteroidales bacterium]|nr:hypothetical protein [Bacteroidales bacterium]